MTEIKKVGITKRNSIIATYEIEIEGREPYTVIEDIPFENLEPEEGEDSEEQDKP